ncbi:unnamed protein product [Acanthosepion pharaonis]|uniref:Uncharacterized protein n=1 Tax=Acanthosepion pharaonis TaxID=158019 RepID=A0A812C7C9_ACAPH|nr:unnamed protein product [Sepia pharaonis]
MSSAVTLAFINNYFFLFIRLIGSLFCSSFILPTYTIVVILFCSYLSFFSMLFAHFSACVRFFLVYIHIFFLPSFLSVFLSFYLSFLLFYSLRLIFIPYFLSSFISNTIPSFAFSLNCYSIQYSFLTFFRSSFLSFFLSSFLSFFLSFFFFCNSSSPFLSLCNVILFILSFLSISISSFAFSLKYYSVLSFFLSFFHFSRSLVLPLFSLSSLILHFLSFNIFSPSILSQFFSMIIFSIHFFYFLTSFPPSFLYSLIPSFSFISRVFFFLSIFLVL